MTDRSDRGSPDRDQHNDPDDPVAPDVPGWQEPWGEPYELDEDDDVVIAVRGILATAGPLAEADLLDRLVTDGLIGLHDRHAAEEALFDVPRLMPLRDGRLVYLPTLAEGRTFTRRMTALEIEEQRLACNPDPTGSAPRRAP